jgi:serine/threonine protein kinase
MTANASCGRTLAASINHPNLVYVFGSEEIDGNLVIVMELVGGGTLRQRVKNEGPLPVTEAVEIILKVIDGLEALATAGVLHRDLKPANVFIASDGTVKVGDFGLSVSTRTRSESRSKEEGLGASAAANAAAEGVQEESLVTARGSPRGTRAYASPEQWRGDESIDVGRHLCRWRHALRVARQAPTGRRCRRYAAEGHAAIIGEGHQALLPRSARAVSQ